MLGCEGGGRGPWGGGWLGVPAAQNGGAPVSSPQGAVPASLLPSCRQPAPPAGRQDRGEKHPVHFQGSRLIEGGPLSQIPKARESRGKVD